MSLTDLDRIKMQQQNPRAIALWMELQSLRSCVSFMNTGAHPDDETSPMLAALGLREGVKLSQACSTRGESGQNSIGLESFKNLGVVRTREMERAAKVLNMSQYWLSSGPDDLIFDFGFSKSGEETLNKWGRQRTLQRFVAILRREKPDIVCPTFLDVPGQHGHHRAMTQSAFEAVLLAADPCAFPEQNLAPWQVKKIYLPAWSGAGQAYDDDVPPPKKTTLVDAGGTDPVTGADYAQIAQWSRAFHATQQMGTWIESGGPSLWPLNLAWAANGKTGPEPDIFDNLPHTLRDLASFAGAVELKPLLSDIQQQLEATTNAWPNDEAIIKHACAALILLDEATKACPAAAKGEVLHRLKAKENSLSKILLLANSITCATALFPSQARPGETLTVTLNLHAPDIKPEAKIIAPKDWVVSAWQNKQCQVTIPDDAPPEQGYRDTWLANRANAPLHLCLSWQQHGARISTRVDLDEDLYILPRFSATLSPAARLINLNAPKPARFSLLSRFPADAEISLQNIAGWKSGLDEKGFTLTPEHNVQPGLYKFGVFLNDTPAQTVHHMHYAHTGDLVRSHPLFASVRVLNIKLPEAKIAYIGGGSDRVDYWLERVGIEVASLSDADLERADFDRFDTVLVGIFALRTRPALALNLKKLHDWVREGGNLVTLYHRPWDNWDPRHTGLAPITIGQPSLRWRITDENAAVSHLQPDHPLLNQPNKISADDWNDWHKERGLYFASEWDSRYQPLLSMADPNEAPLSGSLLSGKFGRGRHTHTSLILHHQLEMLVPGAYRLMANLLNGT